MNHFLESILDVTQDRLDPDVFSDEVGQYRIRSDVKGYIEGLAYDYFVLYGRIVEMYIVGSILSFQWTHRSDIDVTVVFIPDTEEDLKRASTKAGRLADTVFLPSTNHPINFFIRQDFDELDYDGIYSLIDNKWIKGPYDISVSAPEVEEYLDAFRGLISRIDLTSGELRRDVIDYQKLQGLSSDKLKSLSSEVKVKLREIDKDVKELASIYQVVHALRKSVFGRVISPEEIQGLRSRGELSPNILYKLLERYHYTDLLRGVRDVLRSSDQQIDEPEEVLAIADILGVEEMTVAVAAGPYERPLKKPKRKQWRPRFPRK